MERDDSVFVEDTSGAPLVLDGTTWSAMMGKEKTVFDFTSGRMVVMKRGGRENPCTYTLADGVLTVTEPGAKAGPKSEKAKRQYHVVSYTDKEIQLAHEETGSTMTLFAGENAGDDAEGEGQELDLCLVGTAIPSGSKLLQE